MNNPDSIHQEISSHKEAASAANRQVQQTEQLIAWEDFLKVDLRVGRVLQAELNSSARKPANTLLIDFGTEIGIRKSSAQITALYPAESLIGKLVVAVVNFPKKQIGSMMSECLVTGFHNADGQVALCVPDLDVPIGTKLL